MKQRLTAFAVGLAALLASCSNQTGANDSQAKVEVFDFSADYSKTEQKLTLGIGLKRESEKDAVGEFFIVVGKLENEGLLKNPLSEGNNPPVAQVRCVNDSCSRSRVHAQGKRINLAGEVEIQLHEVTKLEPTIGVTAPEGDIETSWNELLGKMLLAGGSSVIERIGEGPVPLHFHIEAASAGSFADNVALTYLPAEKKVDVRFHKGNGDSLLARYPATLVKNSDKSFTWTIGSSALKVELP